VNHVFLYYALFDKTCSLFPTAKVGHHWDFFFLVIVNLEHWFLPFVFYFRVIPGEPEIESWKKEKEKKVL
jgi:hypothetical protein